MNLIPAIQDIQEAAKRIQPHIHRTPVFTCSAIDRMVKAQIYFKCENFQKVGAFKFRGACNAVFSLSQGEIVAGVATHSSGNHAAALALAAQKRNTKAYIVMPRNAPEIKKKAVASYGAEIFFCEPTLAAREAELNRVIQITGAIPIHPYNDYKVIAGQGTAAMELLEDVSCPLDIVMAPVGGGGLLGGTSVAVHALSPQTKVIGAEPEAADDACKSFHAGKIIPVDHPETIADGLRTSLGDKTFPLIKEYVYNIVTTREEMIVNAMRHIWERMKIIVEPSSAVPLAALLENKLDCQGKRIGIILSGGNLDLERLPWVNYVRTH